jgi:hypothetical protein
LELQGKTVRAIYVDVREIFDEQQAPAALYRTANDWKAATREHVVRRELLLNEGDPFDSERFLESVRNVRGLSFLRNVRIVPVPDGDVVDLRVSVQDVWTLVPRGSFAVGSGSDKLALGVAESNLLGLGKRAELQYEEKDGRSGFEAVYADRRFWGSDVNLGTGAFLRDDGERMILSVREPFRSISQQVGWSFDADLGDTVGRLFEDADELYIYRQERVDIRARYTVGSPESPRSAWRYGFGAQVLSERFAEARDGDYDSLDLDREDLSADPKYLAEDRRYIGPLFSIERVESDFVSLPFIDRFDRVEDFNLGLGYGASALVAPEFLGSFEDALIASGNVSMGRRTGDRSFARGELGFTTRITDSGTSNSILRAEGRWYNVVGAQYWGSKFLGHHTLAASAFLDYGREFDPERQLSVGGSVGPRGYKERTFNGDKRYAVSLEDRIHFTDQFFELVSLGGAMFVDVGGATDRPIGELFGARSFADVGVGLRFAFPRFGSGQVVRLDVAFPLRDGPDGSGEFEPRILISTGQQFGGKLRSEADGFEAASVGIGFDR